MTMEGRYVRAAYNNEGYVILGYRLVNLSVGEKWMLLEVGMTVRDGVDDYTLKRDAISLETPDGKTIPWRRWRSSGRATRGRWSLGRRCNAIPSTTSRRARSRACRIGFFSQMDSRAMAWDQVDLSYQRACLGRLYFEIPGGITYGQHWLNVKFKDSLDPRPVPDPDQGRRQAARQALQEHREAGRGGLLAAEEELTGLLRGRPPVARPREHVTLRAAKPDFELCQPAGPGPRGTYRRT